MHTSYESSRGKSTPETRQLRLDDLTLVIQPHDARAPTPKGQAIDKLPPAVVITDGEHLWYADNVRRHQAVQRAGRDSMACEVRDGTWEDAMRLSASASEPLTRAGKIQATRDALKYDRENKIYWSDRDIEKLTTASRMTAWRCRRDPSYGGHAPAADDREVALAALECLEELLAANGALVRARKHLKTLQEVVEAIP